MLTRKAGSEQERPEVSPVRDFVSSEKRARIATLSGRPHQRLGGLEPLAALLS